MVTPLVNQYTPVAVTRQSVGTTLSILPDATALDAAPANAGMLMDGYDNANALQRHIRVNASGQIVTAGAGAAFVQGDFDSAPQDETTANVLWVRAAITARDTAAAATVQNRLLEARGALAAQAYTAIRLFTDAVVRGDDSATYSAIGARSALAAQAYTIVRLATDGVLRADDGATYSVPGTRASLAAQAYTLQRLLVDGVMRADDGSTYSVPSTRAATFISGGATDTLQTLLTHSFVLGRDSSVPVARIAEARGAIAAQAYTLVRLFTDGVVRGDDGATYSAIGTRSGNGVLATTFNRLLVDSAVRGFDPPNTSFTMAELVAASVSGNFGDMAVVQGRESAFKSSLRGRRYSCKSPNLTGVAAATSFTATTPTFLLVAGATNELIIRRIIVCSPLIGTSTTFRASVKTDTVDRFSAGGTARAPATWNGGNAVATTVARNLETPTATAEGGGTRDIMTRSGLITSGGEIIFEFKDGLIIPASGSLLLYVVTATAGETIDYTIEFEDANVQ